MLDIDFLSSPPSLKCLLLYRYRSGLLRQRMRKHIATLGELYPCEAVELRSMWCSPGLFEGIRFCDLSEQIISNAKLNDLRSLFGVPPAVPTIIFMRASESSSFDEPADTGIVLIDEPVVTVENVHAVLRFFEQISDLIPSKVLSGQKSFQQYFHRWAQEKITASLPELVQEFEKAILLYSDLQTAEFVLPATDEVSQIGPSYVVRILRRFIAAGTSGEAIDLLRALSRKQERGWDEQDLVHELLAATSWVLEKPDVRGNGVSSLHGTSQPNGQHQHDLSKKMTLWVALLLVWSAGDHKQSSVSGGQERNDFLVRADKLLRTYRQRLMFLNADPLSGTWEALRRVLSKLLCSVLEPHDPKLMLLQRLQGQENAGRASWLDRVSGVAAPKATGGPSVVAGPPRSTIFTVSEPNSFSALVGREAAISQIRKRFADDDHGTPLMLVGPEGAGKRTFARIYTRAFLCEGEIDGELSSCGCCSACRTFDTHGSFGYIKIDAGHSEALAHARDQIQKLRYVTLSRRRIVVIKNPEGAPAAIDALLKTFEDGAVETSFVILARDEWLVRAAAISRSFVCKFGPLPDGEARRLLGRWISPTTTDARVIDLILAHGRRLPGPMLELCKRILSGNVSTTEAAKALFSLDWGREALDYWCSLLASHPLASTGSRPFHEKGSAPVVQHVRTVLYHLNQRGKHVEPALWGLEKRIEHASSLLEDRANDIGVSRKHLWLKLAEFWSDAEVTDSTSFQEAGAVARGIILGKSVARLSIVQDF